MKRSEAVLAIMECLVEPHFPDDAEKEATYILKKLQKKGMLPPKIYVDDGEWCGWSYEWEPEDNG